MITKEQFIKFITEYDKFSKSIDRISEAIYGNNYGSLYDSDWFNSVGLMFDTFMESHFTDKGCDLINSYMFDDFDGSHGIIIYEPADIFYKEKKVVIETLDELWIYLNCYKSIYIKNE